MTTVSRSFFIKDNKEDDYKHIEYLVRNKLKKFILIKKKKRRKTANTLNPGRRCTCRYSVSPN